MGPVNKIQGRKPRSFKMEAITKQCPECKSECALGLRTCFSCGHIFDVQDREIKLNRDASGLSILDEGHSEFRTYPVTDITYSRHSKKGKTPSLRVDYYSGLRRVTSEWICIEHQGYAWQRAHRWWQKRIDSPIPYSVGLALDQTSKLRWPDTVTVDTKDKFSTIVRYDFNKHPL
jgi:DNA repair protein RadD